MATYPLPTRPRLVLNARRCDSVVINRALYCRDWTQSAWTKSNMTTALTQTGVDGTANSATLLTASAGNATAKQSVTRTSSDWVYGVFIKRVTGTGNIDLTLDNGSTWTTQTISADYWTQCGITQTLANPSFGIRIVTNGDAVAVDYALASVDSVSATAFTPILTTTANAYLGVEAIPLTEWSKQDWDRFIYKNNIGLPIKYYLEKQRTQTLMTFWPVPSFTSGSYGVNIGYERAWQIISSGADNIDIPEEFMETAVMCLASRLIEDYQLPETNDTARIRQRAATLYQEAMRFDRSGEVRLVIQR
jgi:hypothetical protein